MKGKEPTDESKARYIRRHEISFSAIQGDHSEDYLDRYLYEHSSQGKMDIVDKMVAKIDRKLLRKSMFKLPEKDRIILCQYLTGTKQNKIAESLGMSPSAVHQYLEKIIYNYRAILCNRKEFQESSFYDKFQAEAEYMFNAYLREVRLKGILNINLNEVKQLIKDTKKAITHSISTKSNMNIREQLSKQIDYSNLDDKYIEQMNKAFAEQGIEAHFERLKTFKGNIMQVLKMVDNFIEELENKTYQNESIERWHFGIDNTKLLNLVLSGKKKATCYLYRHNEDKGKVGDISIITRFDGKDACVIQTEEIKVLPFNEMTWNLAKLEGEHKNLEDWRRDHTNFFRNEYRDFKENTLIVFEKFKVLKKF